MAHAKTIKDERVTTQILVAVGQRAGGMRFYPLWSRSAQKTPPLSR